MPKKQMITCPKCHGNGYYKVPIFDDETWMPSETEYETSPCELCGKTGKVTIEFYEKIQAQCREDSK